MISTLLKSNLNLKCCQRNYFLRLIIKHLFVLTKPKTTLCPPNINFQGYFFLNSCGMSTIRTEIHTSLLMHVTDEESKTTENNSFTDLLQNYFASESMDGCYCDNCQSNQRKSIRYNLEKLPR